MAYTGTDPDAVGTNPQNSPLLSLPIVTGQVGMPKFSAMNGVLAANITTASDATYALAVTFGNNSISGVFCIGFVGSNRVHNITFCCDARLADTSSSLSIINTNSFAGNDIFSNLRIVQQNSNSFQYILVDVANRNGSTGPINISWYGNLNFAPTLAPAAPGANTAVPTYGMFMDTTGNYTQLAGSYTLAGVGSKLFINAGTPASASIGTSGAMTLGAVTVNTAAVTANSYFPMLQTHTLGTITVPASYYVNRASIVPGVSFVITSNQPTDTSTVDYLIVN